MLVTVKNAVETELGKTFATFRGLSFTTQVVAGTNYLFKVDVGGEYIHVKVHKPLPHTGNPPHLMKVQGGFELDSPLAPI